DARRARQAPPQQGGGRSLPTDPDRHDPWPGLQVRARAGGPLGPVRGGGGAALACGPVRLRFRLVPVDDEFFTLFSASARNTAEASRRLRELVNDPTHIDQHLEMVVDC